jgi:hypothetical protein
MRSRHPNARLATACSGYAHLSLRDDDGIRHTVRPHGSGSRQAAAGPLPGRRGHTLGFFSGIKSLLRRGPIVLCILKNHGFPVVDGCSLL